MKVTREGRTWIEAGDCNRVVSKNAIKRRSPLWICPILAVFGENKFLLHPL